MLCEYGCGNEAKYQFKNGKWCCSKNISKCINIIKKLKNRIVSSETRKKQSNSLIGKSAWNKGKILSSIHKNRIGLGNKGKLVSNETKLKISNANKGKQIRLGMKHTQETKDKISKSNKGKIAWNKNTNHKLNTIEILKIANKLTLNQLIERYPTFSKIEDFRYNPNNLNEREIQVHCKNHNCSNSKEQGGWFTPTKSQITERVRAIESNSGNDGSYFYCSDKCKNECPLFNINPSSIINQNNISDEIIYTPTEYQTWRQEVLNREDYKCEYCGEKAIDVHHSRPQKLEPFYSLDPDFGIACCKSCHYEKGHKDECSTGQLANKVCI